MLKLIKDKYFPCDFNDFSIHRDLSKRLLKFSDKELISTILYGSNGCGKYTIAINMLINFFDKSVLNKKTLKFNLKVQNNYKYVSILGSCHHYEIYINKYSFNDNYTLIALLEKMIETRNIFNGLYKVILIKNIHHLNTSAIQYLCFASEKHCDNVRFILTTNNISFYKKIKSFFFYIRVPKPEESDLLNYIEHISKKENIKLNLNQKKDIINRCTFNMNKICLNLDMIKSNDNLYINYKNYISIEVKNIINMILKGNIGSVEKIRKKIYEITSKNIDQNLMFKYFVDKLIKSNISNEKKYKILKSASFYQSKISKSYRSIIHLEAFIFSLFNILTY